MKFQNTYLQKYLGSFSLKLLFATLLFFFAVGIFFIIMDEMVLEKENSVDFQIFKFLQENIINNGLTDFMYGITHFCSAPFIKIAYPILILALVISKNYKKAIFSFLAGAGGMILVFLVKYIFQRPRPAYPLVYKETGYSFPSGHATLSFVLYGTLAFLLWRTNLPKFWRILGVIFLISLSLTIGFSRIYLRVHYPSDVLAGFCLGYSWLFLLIFIFKEKFDL